MRCPAKSRQRVSKKKGTSKHPGLKGHSWQKTPNGRQCTACGKQVIKWS